MGCANHLWPELISSSHSVDEIQPELALLLVVRPCHPWIERIVGYPIGDDGQAREETCKDTGRHLLNGPDGPPSPVGRRLQPGSRHVDGVRLIMTVREHEIDSETRKSVQGGRSALGLRAAHGAHGPPHARLCIGAGGGGWAKLERSDVLARAGQVSEATQLE
jgi:hypothetical protein